MSMLSGGGVRPLHLVLLRFVSGGLCARVFHIDYEC